MEQLEGNAKLGVRLYTEGQYERAKQAFLEACKHLGLEHPNRLLIQNNIGAVYFMMKKYGDAKGVLDYAAEGMERQNRPETLLCKRNLAWTCAMLGDLDKAETLMREIIASLKNTQSSFMLKGKNMRGELDQIRKTASKCKERLKRKTLMTTMANKSTTIAISPTEMDALPIETIHNIATFLPLQDALTFCLTVSPQWALRHGRSAIETARDIYAVRSSPYSHFSHFKDPLKLLASMTTYDCVLAGSRAAAYFYPDIAATSSAWNFYVSDADGIDAMIAALSDAGVSWRSPETMPVTSRDADADVPSSCYVVDSRTLRGCPQVSGTCSRDTVDFMLQQMEHREQEIMRAKVDGLNDEPRSDFIDHNPGLRNRRLYENSITPVHAFRRGECGKLKYLGPQFSSDDLKGRLSEERERLERYGEDGGMSWYHTDQVGHGGVRVVYIGTIRGPDSAPQRVQLMQCEKNVTVFNAVVNFYASHIQCIITGTAAFHLYGGHTRANQAASWDHGPLLGTTTRKPEALKRHALRGIEFVCERSIASLPIGNHRPALAANKVERTTALLSSEVESVNFRRYIQDQWMRRGVSKIDLHHLTVAIDDYNSKWRQMRWVARTRGERAVSLADRTPNISENAIPSPQVSWSISGIHLSGNRRSSRPVISLASLARQLA
jgi:hypothetical protein